MIAIIISGPNHKLALNFGRQLAKDIFFSKHKNIEIYGPTDAKISKIGINTELNLVKVEKIAIQSLLSQIRAKNVLFYKCKN